MALLWEYVKKYGRGGLVCSFLHCVGDDGAVSKMVVLSVLGILGASAYCAVLQRPLIGCNPITFCGSIALCFVLCLTREWGKEALQSPTGIDVFAAGTLRAFYRDSRDTMPYATAGGQRLPILPHTSVLCE